MENPEAQGGQGGGRIRVHHRERRTRALGPGIRYALWTQGCDRRCPGCLAPDARTSDGGYWLPAEELLAEVLEEASRGIRGITISGGEPFLQPAPLAWLAARLRRNGLDVLVFSGRAFDELQEMARVEGDAAAFLSEIDILVDGPYVQALNDGHWLRGSSNKGLRMLSGAYSAHADAMRALRNRDIEFVVRPGGGVFVVGVPPAGFQERWESERAIAEG